jgi:lupus La protein
VEFYFGNNNLPRDNFLWNLTGGADNKPVPIKTICNFKRMQRFKPYEAVVAALRESSFLDVEGADGDEQVKRKRPYEPTHDSSKYLENTIYAKGFGDEQPSTQFDLEAFFTKFGPTNAVRLRRDAAGAFKGSVFVEFADKETAENFVQLEPKPQWNGADLKIMTKRDYVEEKNELIRKGEIEPSSSRPKRFFEGKVHGKRHHDQGGFKGGRGGYGRDKRGRGFRGGRGGSRGARRLVQSITTLISIILALTNTKIAMGRLASDPLPLRKLSRNQRPWTRKVRPTSVCERKMELRASHLQRRPIPKSMQ